MESKKDILDFTILELINICKDSSCDSCKIKDLCNTNIKDWFIKKRIDGDEVKFTTNELKLLKEMFGGINRNIYLYRESDSVLSWSIYPEDFDGHRLPNNLFPSAPVGICINVNKYLK